MEGEGKDKKDEIEEQEETDELSEAERERDKEWERLEAEERGEKPPEDPPKPESGKEQPASDGKPASETEDKGGEKPSEEPKSEIYGTVESMEKSIQDSSRQIRQLQQEKDNLARELEAHKKGTGSEAAVDEAAKKLEATKTKLKESREKVVQDYPEMAELIDSLIEGVSTLDERLTDYAKEKAQKAEADKENEAREAHKKHYVEKIKPEVVKVHADIDSIMENPTEFQKYWNWAQTQSPATRFAALHSGDPQDIISAVSAYKKFKATPEAEAAKEAEEKKNKEKQDLSKTIRSSGSDPVPEHAMRGASKQGKDDYDAGWDESEKLLKQEGVE